MFKRYFYFNIYLGDSDTSFLMITIFDIVLLFEKQTLHNKYFQAIEQEKVCMIKQEVELRELNEFKT